MDDVVDDDGGPSSREVPQSARRVGPVNFREGTGGIPRATAGPTERSAWRVSHPPGEGVATSVVCCCWVLLWQLARQMHFGCCWMDGTLLMMYCLSLVLTHKNLD